MKKTQLLLLVNAVVWTLVVFAAIGGGTYAWFHFDPYTKVEPLSSTISSGEVALLIANDPNGVFEENCTLSHDVSEALLPISTVDLNRFYTATTQTKAGITTGYRDVSDTAQDRAIHGTVYLKSLRNDCDVYLYRQGMYVGQDNQALAAMRLGMKITTPNDIKTFIFKLDEMGNTSGAEAKVTTTQKNVVVGNVTKDGSISLSADPARAMGPYFATPNPSDERFPKAGAENLITLQQDEIATVEYWLYLEGCDENCINVVQKRDVGLQLSFAGVSSPTGETGN